MRRRVQGFFRGERCSMAGCQEEAKGWLLAPANPDGPKTLPETEDGLVVTPGLVCHPCGVKASRRYLELLAEQWEFVEASQRDDLAPGYRGWPCSRPLRDANMLASVA